MNIVSRIENFLINKFNRYRKISCTRDNTPRTQIICFVVGICSRHSSWLISSISAEYNGSIFLFIFFLQYCIVSWIRSITPNLYMYIVHTEYLVIKNQFHRNISPFACGFPSYNRFISAPNSIRILFGYPIYPVVCIYIHIYIFFIHYLRNKN